MKKYCVIGARSGSKGIIDKNIQTIGDFSLLEIALLKLQSMNFFDLIIVSTDSDSYIDLLNKYIDNSTKIIKRPLKLSLDNSIEIDYIRHAVKDFINDDDIICRLQATSPFQRRESMLNAVKTLIHNYNNLDSVQIVTPSANPVYKAMRINDKQLLESYIQGEQIHPTNRQKKTKSFFRSNFYCFKGKNLFNEKWLGSKSFALIGEDSESIEIDGKFDLITARALAKFSWSYLDLP